MFLLSSYWVLYCALCYSSFGDAVLSDKDCENVYELVYSSHRQVQCSLLLYFFNNKSSVVSKWLITSQLYMYVTSYQGAIFKISLTLELLFTIKSHFIIKIKLSWWPIFMIQHACFWWDHVLTDCGKHNSLCSIDSWEYPSHLHCVQVYLFAVKWL